MCSTISASQTSAWNDNNDDNSFDVDDDFIFDVLGIKDHSTSNMNNYQQQRNSPTTIQQGQVPVNGSGSAKVILEGEKHIFRHAKEVQKGSRGGYLKGFITLPLDARNRILRVELSVVPSLADLLVHPHLLHLTVFGESQKKASYKTPLKSPSDWRMNFVVEYGVKVYHIPNYGNQKPVQLPDNCLENKDGQTRLLLGNNKLLINIISSLQGGAKKEDSEGDVITNIDVINRRIAEEAWQYPEIQNQGKDLAKKLATKYTSKECKVELHRCCLRACIFDESSKKLIDTAISEVISNARDKNVGYLDLRSISDPGCCCTKGGWRFFLISEHKLARDKATGKQETEEETADRSPPVVPMLVLADNDNNIVENTNGTLPLNQIPTDQDSFEVHGDAFSIILPPQNPVVLDMIRRQGLHCRIFLYRCLDKKYSNSSVKFVYYDHGAFEDNCPFCMIKRVSQLSLESAFSNGTGSGKRPRKRAKTSSGSVQSPADSSMSMSPYYDSTSGISSPGSTSSPEHTPGNINDQLSYQLPHHNSVEAFSAHSSNSNIGYSQEGYTLDYWGEMQGSSELNQIPENMDGMWLKNHEIGSLIFELDNNDLNTLGNVPIADSCQPKRQDKIVKKDISEPEVSKVEAKSKVAKSEKEFKDAEEKVEAAFKKLQLTEKASNVMAEDNRLIKSDFGLEIFAVVFAVVLYYIGCYVYN